MTTLRPGFCTPKVTPKGGGSTTEIQKPLQQLSCTS